MPVYMIRAGADGPVKIGRTNNLAKRLPVLQTSSAAPLSCIRLLAGEGDLERQLHERFARQRLKGEWFTFSPDMLGDVGAEDLGFQRERRRRKEHPPWSDEARARLRASRQAARAAMTPEQKQAWGKRHGDLMRAAYARHRALRAARLGYPTKSASASFPGAAVPGGEGVPALSRPASSSIGGALHAPQHDGANST